MESNRTMSDGQGVYYHVNRDELVAIMKTRGWDYEPDTAVFSRVLPDGHFAEMTGGALVLILTHTEAALAEAERMACEQARIPASELEKGNPA